MGTDDVEVEEMLPSPKIFKVHHSMCTELKKLVDRIDAMFPDIEEARPRCSSGIQSLCLLNSAIDKTKQLLEYCLESSKLYLAITGDTILSRCKKSKNMLEQSLCQIQTVVPVMLSAEISHIIDDLRATMLMLDSSEEEARNVLLDLLLRRDTSASNLVENNEKKALKLAASRLHIASQTDILVEMRAIKKLLTKVGEKDRNKKKILSYFLVLLKKYGKSVAREQRDERNVQDHRPDGEVSKGDGSVYRFQDELESRLTISQDRAQTRTFTLPEKLKCPISGKLMYDPVLISSGETFERMWIQKWFDEGHVTCPKTQVKLADFSLTSNKVVKSLISDWCVRHGVTVTDPNKLAFQSLDVSYSSIASLGSSMNDLHLPLDASNVSLRSSDFYSGSCTTLADGSTLASTVRREGSDVEQTHVNEADLELLSRLVELPWESKCKVVEDVKCQLQSNCLVSLQTSYEILVGSVLTFLRDASNNHELNAQRMGSELLLALVRKSRDQIVCLDDDAFSLLTSFLDSEVTDIALAILDTLSSHSFYRPMLSASGALVSLVELLDSPNKKFQEAVIKVLHSISSEKEICSRIVSLGCIPRLVPFIGDRKLARYCIELLKNLCDTEEARVSVAETNGCIASIAELLENGSHEEQEHAVDVLLSLCSMRVEYCHLVMSEMIIPSLVYISNNGSDKGKVRALELRRQLRDVDFECKENSVEPDLGTSREADNFVPEEEPAPKARGLFRKIFKK